MSTADEQPEQWPAEGALPIEELARRQGVEPVASLDELAQPDLWDSDEEYEEFLADLYPPAGPTPRELRRPRH